MNGGRFADDGPSPEELVLWDDLAEIAEELREARATIARLEAENAQLRAASAGAPRERMGAAA